MLSPGEDPVLSPEQAVWLGELHERFGRLVERMFLNRLMGQGVEFARAVQWQDDLVQQFWLNVARGQGGLLTARGAEEGELRGRLAWQVKSTVSAHWRAGHLKNEWSTDWTGPTGRPLDPVAGPMVDPGRQELTDHCEQLLAALTPQMREAVVEVVCLDRTYEAAGELLGLNHAVVHRLVQRAVRRLRGEDGPEPARLEELPAAQRAALESMPERARAVLLLRLAGVGADAVAERLEVALRTVYNDLKRYAPLLEAAAPGQAPRLLRSQVKELPEGWEELAPLLAPGLARLVRSRIEGLSWKAIADQAGRPVASLRTDHSRAVRRLWELAAEDRTAALEQARAAGAGVAA